MKFLLSVIFLSLLSLYSLAQTSVKTKHALIFAIGDYPEANGWPKISSVKDVGYIKKALEGQQFQDKNITIVTDSNATMEGINSAFVELINSVKSGDIVVVHFSSHGEQVKADNNNKIDGLDECIVSYNAISPLQSNDFDKDQAQYLRGHILGSYLKQLRTKLGRDGDVIVFMDNCHSGNGTRGAAKVRGGLPPLVPKGYNPQKQHKISDSSILFRETNISDDESSLASYEVISATRPEEPDFEILDDNGEGVGSLSYAISKSFASLEPGSTYRSFFAKVQSIMNEKVPSQHPLLEGNGIDRKMFGGAFISQKPYIEISEIVSNNQIIIKGGLLAGLDSGAKVALYPSGTTDPSKAKSITTGTIAKSESFSSTVNLDTILAINQASDDWVFITKKIYKVDPIDIKIISTPSRGIDAVTFSATEVKNIETGLAGYPYARFNEKPELLIIKGRGEDSIKIAGNGYLFKTIKNAVNDSTELKEDLQKYAQYKFLQSLQVNDPTVSFDVKLVPVINGRADTSKINSKMVNGVYEFREKDTVTLWIKNTGIEDAYINILDMQPDGIINPILPNRAQNIYPNELKLNAGSEYMFPPQKYSLVIYPPYGTEVFKIFGSSTEIDLESITSTKGEGTRGNLSVLEGLVKNSYGTRGAQGTDVNNADGTTNNLLFRILPR
ncbi:MAG TPA: caspase family protein [Ferruginibacter sp.]|jgi:hypothetical protein|nr:caspase family protein [Ferruginibacter sp.]